MNPNAQTPAAAPLTLRDCTINIRFGGTDHHGYSTRGAFSEPLIGTLEVVERTNGGAGGDAAAGGEDTALPRYLKFSAEGSAMADSATDHAGVWDRQTGLMWSNTLGDSRLSHEDAEKACAELQLAGHADWRLPSRQELQTILDLTKHDPAIDTSLFPGTKSEAYWSGCRLAADPDYAWIVSFYHGSVYNDRRDDDARVRAVRVASAPPRQ
jgi:hypothetical protein